jgi:para-nitrobenzyl esterase
MRRAFFVLGSLATMLGCSGGSDLPSEASTAQGVGTVVQTKSGTIEGHVAEDASGVTTFRGVPYAKPPVGELRFRPPEPTESWDGSRPATSSGLPCWQPISAATSIYSRGEIERSEDCLYLNLFTPAKSADERLPVMVWFHGGGHQTGHGNSATFDGTALAQKGVILVAVNYRLGHLGFMAHPALTAESAHGSSGNYGILDKIAALEWVKNNITAFGGDPGNVTVFGQSAGSASVCTLMASPLAAGLMHKVIGHSGSCTGRRMELDSGAQGSGQSGGPSAHDLGLNLAAEFGIEGDGQAAAAALRALAPAAFLGATAEARSPGIQVDGWVVPRQMGDIFAAGEHNDVPLIAGWMADEGKGLYATMPDRSLTELQEYVRTRFADRAESILAAYSEEIAESPRAAQQAIQGDASFGLGTRTWVRHAAATGTPVFQYFFSHARQSSSSTKTDRGKRFQSSPAAMALITQATCRMSSRTNTWSEPAGPTMTLRSRASCRSTGSTLPAPAIPMAKDCRCGRGTTPNRSRRWSSARTSPRRLRLERPSSISSSRRASPLPGWSNPSRRRATRSGRQIRSR